MRNRPGTGRNLNLVRVGPIPISTSTPRVGTGEGDTLAMFGDYCCSLTCVTLYPYYTYTIRILCVCSVEWVRFSLSPVPIDYKRSHSVGRTCSCSSTAIIAIFLLSTIPPLHRHSKEGPSRPVPLPLVPDTVDLSTDRLEAVLWLVLRFPPGDLTPAPYRCRVPLPLTGRLAGEGAINLQATIGIACACVACVRAFVLIAGGSPAKQNICSQLRAWPLPGILWVTLQSTGRLVAGAGP
jgi:hypothetical protein